MNEKNGKDLVPRNGRPGEVSEQRTYTVNMARKRDWLDVVGDIIGPPNYDVNLSFFGNMAKDWQSFKRKPSVALQAWPIVAGMALVGFLGMDSYKWDFAKCADDFMHAIPLGGKVNDAVMSAAVPASRSRPGETAAETQRRRDCLEDLVFRDKDRYKDAVQAMVARGGKPFDVCEASSPIKVPQRGSEGFRK